MSCITPPLNQIQPGDDDGITYTVRVDNAPGPDPIANASLQISVLPNPSNFMLIDSTYTPQDIATSSPIRIMVVLLTIYQLLYDISMCAGRES
jgi:hypothetical protein